MVALSIKFEDIDFFLGVKFLEVDFSMSAVFGGVVGC